MKKKVIAIVFVALIHGLISEAQSTIDSVLSQVRLNNKTLLANAGFWEAQKLQFRTGLTPGNPMAEYDYLSGSPAGAGEQHDFTITQQFDFPSAYIKKNQLAKQQSALAEFELTASRQNIILEAKVICIELVYRNKLQKQLDQQKMSTEKWLSDFQIRMDKGEGNILDVNKARLQLIEIRKEFLENTSAVLRLKEKLSSLNGGVMITFNDTVYPVLPVIPEFEKLEDEYEAADPVRKRLEQQKRITQKSLELSRAMGLPKLEAGYHYQGILGQKYNGIHTGISIPIWENRNTVKTQKAKLVFDELHLHDHRTEHYSEIKQLYEKYTALGAAMKEYQDAFSISDSDALLKKAFTLGEISTIEYFMEWNFFNNSRKNYLQTEKEFYAVVAELFKYQL